MNHLPCTNQYTYLGIPFNELLDLKQNTIKMKSKISYTVNSFFGLLTKRNVLFYFKIFLNYYYLPFLLLILLRL